MLRIAVLVSGRGTNLKAILDHVRAGRIKAEVALVLSNALDAPALDHARAAGVAVWAEDHRSYPSRKAFDAAMMEAMTDAGVSAVVLAGYMRLLSGEFIRAYAGRIVNVHPSLLPAFPGVSGGADAVAYGVKIAGCTVHFVEEAMDAGAVIIQAATFVAETDTPETLMERVHTLEHRIYPQAVAWLAEGRLATEERGEGRVVRLAPSAASSLAPGRAKAAPAPSVAEGAFVYPPLEEGF
ncbi:MAG: Phosphoribosylglycinamide formyltransferase [Desulfovibrio sp.]